MNYSEPRAEPVGPAMLVPVRVFMRGSHHWTFDFAAHCKVRVGDGLGLSAVRVVNTEVVAGAGALINVSDVRAELDQGARYLSMLLRDGWSAAELAKQLHAHVGVHAVQIGGAMGFCGSIGGALLLAAQHAEASLQHSAAAELQAAGALSEMG